MIACVDLVGRCGAREFEIGYLHDDVPVAQAGWYASAFYRAPAEDGCRWRRVGKRWEPGCDAPPIEMPAGARGDHAAMNRAMRRRIAKGRP